MSDCDGALLRAGADYVSHIEIPALQAFAAILKRNSEEHKGEGAAQIRDQWPCCLGKDVVCAPAIEFQDYIVADRGDLMAMAERSTSQRGAGINFEIAAEEHSRH